MISSTLPGSSRKAMCSPQLRPTMTRSPFSRAMSKSQRGGPVWTRTTLKPFDHLRIQSLLAVVVDEERAVADAPDPELLLPDVQELPADRRAADDQRPFDGDCRCDLGHVHHSFETERTLAESGAIPRSSGSGAPVLARSSVFSPRHTRPRAEGLAGFSQSPAGLRTPDGFGGPVERPGERKNRFHF